MYKNLISLFILVGIGEDVAGQVQFGLKAGWNYSTAYVLTPSGGKPDVKGGHGFHIGTQLKVPFDVKLFFLPQLQYSYKTFTVQYEEADTLSNKLNYHYLEIPLLFQLDLRHDHLAWFFQFGPSFSIAMAGNEIITKMNGSTSSNPIRFAFDSYGRLEANAVLNVGYRFQNNVSVTGGFALGMGTVVDDDYGPEIKPRMFTLSLNYWLKK